MADNSPQPSNSVDQNQILQALMLRMGNRNGMSGIPGAAQPAMAPPPAPQPMANSAPTSQPTSQPASGGIPEGVAPSGAARQLSPASPTPFNGTFGSRQGIISQLVDSAEKKSHDKKVNEAMMYYNQINSFLASNDPKDQQKAQQLLDDPKIRKILKTGLDYVPLEEEVPPEAIGIHQAQQRIDQKQSAIQKLQQMLTGGQKQGNAQPRPPRKAVIPQASQEAQQKYELGQSKIGTEVAHAEEYRARGEAETSKAISEQEKAESQRIKDEADALQAKAYADNARSQAKLYEAQAKEAGDNSPSVRREKEAHAREMDALARYHDAMAKYVKNKDGKMPSSALQSQIKSARGDMVSLLRGYMSDNKEAAKAVTKDTGYIFGPKQAYLDAQDQAAKKSKDLSKAIAWFDGEGTTAVTENKMTLPDAVSKAYRMAGIEPPVPGVGGSDTPTSTDDEIMKLIGH